MRSHSVDRSTAVVDWVARVVDIPDPVSANAEPPFDAVSNRLPVMRRIVVPAVAMVASSVGLTGVVVVTWHRVGVTTTA
jgi:hypothetical protein